MTKTSQIKEQGTRASYQECIFQKKIYDERRKAHFKAQIPDISWRHLHPDIAGEIKKTREVIGG